MGSEWHMASSETWEGVIIDDPDGARQGARHSSPAHATRRRARERPATAQGPIPIEGKVVGAATDSAVVMSVSLTLWQPAMRKKFAHLSGPFGASGEEIGRSWGLSPGRSSSAFPNHAYVHASR